MGTCDYIRQMQAKPLPPQTGALRHVLAQQPTQCRAAWPHLVPPYGRPSTRPRLGPPCRPQGAPGGAPCWEAQDALDRLASPGSPPPPTHREDGRQGPLPFCRPRWAAGMHTLETISPPRLPASHGLNAPAVWQTPPGKRRPFHSFLLNHREQRRSKRFSRTEASGRPIRFPPGPNQFWTQGGTLSSADPGLGLILVPTEK